MEYDMESKDSQESFCFTDGNQPPPKNGMAINLLMIIHNLLR